MDEDRTSAPSGETAPQDAAGEPGHTPDSGHTAPEHEELSTALESTLDDLSQSITRMESIIRQLEAGGADWDESVRLISEANELAISSSQRLDRVVQDVVYGSTEAGEDDEGPNRQESLDLP